MRANKHLLAFLVLLPLATQVNAQDLIEEIVVTAAKRAQTLQEIPVAVSVTSAETIEKAQIQDIGDLQSVVPSLRVSQLQNSRNTTFIIRGFGNGANNPGVEPSVGVFIDGVYRSRSAAAISDLPRLERVEVLRGPQSTLFGKNASAGVISVVTPKPSGDSGGFVSASVGDYSAVVLKGLYEGSLSDNVVFDISGSINKADGYFENLADGSELNERDRFGVRGQLVYTPSDRTEIRIIADHDEIDELCCGVLNLVDGPTGGAIRALGGQLVPNDESALEGYYDLDAINEVENTGISAQIDVDYDSFTLTSITAFRNNQNLDNNDIDFTSARLVNSNSNDIDIDTFTQEIRLTSNGGENLDWMVGGFYFDESVDYVTDVIYGPQFRSYAELLTAGVPIPGGPLGFIEELAGLPRGQVFFAEGQGVVETAAMDNQALSLFGQVDWHLSDSLTATIGLNYTKDEKEASVSQVNTDVFSGLPLAALGLPPDLVAGLAPLQFLPPFVDFPNVVEDGETDDDDVTYTLRLAYDISDSLNLYASYATGFKATSWNLSRDSRPFPEDIAALAAAGLAVPNLTSGTRFAGPEESEVFELGLKARFDRGSLNVAIFDQVIEGFQSNIFIGTGFVLANAGEQSTTGLEFDLIYYPVDALRLGIAGTLLDPIYDSFVQSAAGDISGQQPAGISEVSLSLSAEYSFLLAGMEAFIRGDYQYYDEGQVVDNSPASIASREISMLNLSAGVTTENGFSFTIWGRNITDDEFLTSAFPSVAQAGSFSGYRNQPRTYGVTLRKDF